MTDRRLRTGATGKRELSLQRPRAPKADRLGRVPRPAALRRLREAMRANLERPEPEESLLPAGWQLHPGDDDQVVESEESIAVATETAGPDGDGLPEYTIYRDDGCHVAPACLSCPLSACIYDGALSPGQRDRRRRNQQIRALARRHWTTARLAERFALSPAQVRRIRSPRKKGS